MGYGSWLRPSPEPSPGVVQSTIGYWRGPLYNAVCEFHQCTVEVDSIVLFRPSAMHPVRLFRAWPMVLLSPVMVRDSDHVPPHLPILKMPLYKNKFPAK